MTTNSPYGPPQPEQPTPSVSGMPGPYSGAGGAGAPPQGAVPPAPAYAPVPYQPAAYAPPQPTNTMAIIALVGGFLTGIVGIICGHIALNQIKRTGEQGRGLALAGLIIGYVITAMWVAIILFYVLYILVFVGIFGALLIGSG